MKDTYNVTYCSGCDNPIDECICKEETSCSFCENIHDILERLDEADSYDEEFAILHSAFSDCQEQCYKQGYVEALRYHAEEMNNIADDIEYDNSDCEDCNCGCED